MLSLESGEVGSVPEGSERIRDWTQSASEMTSVRSCPTSSEDLIVVIWRKRMSSRMAAVSGAIFNCERMLVKLMSE